MSGVWQGILEGFGTVLSFLFDIVGNYGVAIVLLTILVRTLLLPLTIKQTRSMQEMQRIQPLVKEIQRKYKGDRQKMNEEMMKLYKEHRVNPLGGCLPLILQLPVFIALYSVLIGDGGKAVARFGAGATAAIAHLPTGSALGQAIQAGQATFLGMNLACRPTAAGQGLVEVAEGLRVDCGGSWVAAIPFYALVALMVFTTWYQQRQMQAMSGTVNPQMRMMGRIMPVFLGVISISIPAGVLTYWVTTNFWQVGQQAVMLRLRAREGAPAPPGPAVKGDGKGDGKAARTAVTGKVSPGKTQGKTSGKSAAKAAPGRKPKPAQPATPMAPGELSRRSSPGVNRSRNGSRKKRRKR